MSAFGNRIKAAREKVGLNQSQLAQLAGITKAAVSRYESGLREPRVEHLKAIANALNIPINDLTDEILINIPLPDYSAKLLTEQEYNRLAAAEKERYDLRLLADTFPDKLQQKFTETYQKLNKIGKVEAIIRITELLQFSKYTESDPDNHGLSFKIQLEENADAEAD